MKERFPQDDSLNFPEGVSVPEQMPLIKLPGLKELFKPLNFRSGQLHVWKYSVSDQENITIRAYTSTGRPGIFIGFKTRQKDGSFGSGSTEVLDIHGKSLGQIPLEIKADMVLEGFIVKKDGRHLSIELESSQV